MKTNVKVRLFSVLLTVMLCVTMLTACGGSKLDGTYRSQGLISQSFTFDGDQVTKQGIRDDDLITLDPICAAGIDAKGRHGHLISVKGERLRNKTLRVICAIEL